MIQPFQFANGQLAHSKEDLLELCQKHPDDATNYLMREDLEKWLAYIGDYDLAECATSARQTDADDRKKLEEFLNKSYSLTAPAPVATAETSAEAIPVVESVPQEAIAKEVETVEETKEEVASSPSKPEVEPSKNLAQETAEKSSTTAEIKQPTPTPPLKTPTSEQKTTESSKKPSFVQVIAKFVVNILYRNKN